MSVCFKDFCEKLSKTLNRDDASWEYDRLHDFVSDIKESLTSFKFKNFD